MLTKAKRHLLVKKKAAKLPLKFGAKEYKEIEVAAGVYVWYQMTTRHELAAAFKHGGITNNLDGSENHLVTISLPSGERVFPAYGGRHVDCPLTAVQAGFGLTVNSAGAEVVFDPKAEVLPALEPSEQDFSKLLTIVKASDSKLWFRTESEKQKEAKMAAEFEAHLAKISEDLDVASRTGKEQKTKPGRKKKSDAELAEEEAAEREMEAEREDDCVLFDRELFQEEASVILEKRVAIDDNPPVRLDESLMERFIAFRFDSGWDVGTVVDCYDPPKGKQGYNVNVQYPQQDGSRYHALELGAYGVGDEFGAPMASWFLLNEACAAPKASQQTSAKTPKKHKAA